MDTLNVREDSRKINILKKTPDLSLEETIARTIAARFAHDRYPLHKDINSALGQRLTALSRDLVRQVATDAGLPADRITDDFWA